MRARRSVKKQIKTSTGQKEKMIRRMKLINEHIKEEDNNQYRRKINKVVNKLRARGGINGANTWEVLNQLKGRKVEKATAVRSKNGKVLEDPEEIRERQREHFQELLQIKTASSSEEKVLETNVTEAFDTILEIASRMDPLYTNEEDLEESIKDLKVRKCADGTGWKNEFIKFGGEGMKESLLTLFREMERERYTPSEWNDMIIKSLHKKGDVLEMDYKRGIFLTNVISKLYEKVVKRRDKEKVDARTSKNQVGGKTKRCPGDHMLVLVDVLQRNKRLNRKTYLVFGDAVKCFDKLWLRDCLLELYKAGVPPQDIEMLYSMNKEASVTVRTPVGESKPFTCEEIVKQGTVWGPELCCISTDGINRIGENCESNTGKVAFGILGFMDDLFGLGSPNKVRKVIRNMRQLEIEKKIYLWYNKNKVHGDGDWKRSRGRNNGGD